MILGHGSKPGPKQSSQVNDDGSVQSTEGARPKRDLCVVALRKGVFRVLLVPLPLARAVVVKSARREAWKSMVAVGVFCFVACLVWIERRIFYD